MSPAGLIELLKQLRHLFQVEAEGDAVPAILPRDEAAKVPLAVGKVLILLGVFNSSSLGSEGRSPTRMCGSGRGIEHGQDAADAVARAAGDGTVLRALVPGKISTMTAWGLRPGPPRPVVKTARLSSSSRQPGP